MRAREKTSLVKFRSLIIILASSVFVVQFLFHTLHKSFHIKNHIEIFLVLTISLFIFLGLHDKIKTVSKQESFDRSVSFHQAILSIVITLSTTMATYFMAKLFDISTIFSASAVCLLTSFLFSAYEGEALSGVCAGMIGSYLCEDWLTALLIGLVTSILFLAFSPCFLGIGGRGGAIAYIANLICIYFLLDVEPAARLPMEEKFIFPSLLAVFISSFAAYSLHKYKLLSPIKATMFVTLLGTILLPSSMLTLKTAVFSGAIIGMSTTNRIDSLTHLMLVTMINYLLFVASFSILDGIGGKLGFIGLLSYKASVGLFVFIDYAKNEIKKKRLLMKVE
jgi:hypothetical protein